MAQEALGTLEVQRAEFKRRRFLAVPLAGMLVWLAIGIAGLFLPPVPAVWVLFIGTGSIFYVGALISRFTGENFFDKSRLRNEFDRLFYLGMAMSLLVFTIAIPFSWIIQHWIGLAHGVVRALMVLALWYVFPAQRFVVIPAAIVVMYAIAIVVLERRWRAMT